MAFSNKEDLVGLERTGLKLKANAHNSTNSVLQIPGSDGSYLGDEVFGHIAAPNCEYVINGNPSLSDLYLGKVYNTA